MYNNCCEMNFVFKNTEFLKIQSKYALQDKMLKPIDVQIKKIIICYNNQDGSVK